MDANWRNSVSTVANEAGLLLGEQSSHHLFVIIRRYLGLYEGKQVLIQQLYFVQAEQLLCFSVDLEYPCTITTTDLDGRLAGLIHFVALGHQSCFSFDLGHNFLAMGFFF